MEGFADSPRRSHIAGALASRARNPVTPLLATFRGSGMVPDEITADPHFGAAVAGAAALTVALATRLGLPISTTHALLGALVGSGLAAVGEVGWETVGTKAAGPLLLSPVLALGGTLVLDAAVGRRWTRFAPRDRWVGRAHFVSAGAVGFARGLNDTPKIAAVMLIGGSIPTARCSSWWQAWPWEAGWPRAAWHTPWRSR